MDQARANKAIVERLYAETDLGNIAILDELFDESVLNHQSGVTDARAGVSAREKLKEVFRLFYAGFPDTRHTIDQVVTAGDMIAVRVSATGTHTGEMLGVKATGKSITMSGMVMYRIVEGRIVERWADEDRLGFYQQLGVIRLPGDANYR